jgi:iron complex outermembrane receptor protein
MREAINLRRKSVLLGCTAMAAVMLSSAALADDAAPETVVVTGTRFNTDAAPAKASLDTTEPQTIINRAYIENFQLPQADYVSILSIVPGLTGGDPNGTGLSDGGPKNTLRGFQDGNFNLTYDGIPFGDTNGPTHHNISYFPASTIGSIDVDRGPGNAGNLGANTYGGTIKLFSEGLTGDTGAKAVASYGSFGTTLVGLNGQSGDMNAGALGTIRVMANLQYVHSDGALQGQDLFTNNVLLKVEDEINSHWRITLFGDTSFLKENLDDNNGATPAQVAVYGKNFALQSNNPVLPTYSPYNFTSKHTDMDYARVDGDLFGIKIQNTDYTYAYWNHTLSPNNQTQTLCDIENNTSEGNYPGGGSSSTGGGCSAATGNSNLVFSNGVKDTNNAILGYSKQNAYRVYGDILRLSEDYDFGWISGQVRAGVWWETQATHRFKYYFDSVSCFNKGIDVFDVGDEAANAACGVAYKPFQGTYTGSGSKTAIASAKSIQNGDLGFAKDDEHSDWTQYQPFLEWDIHPLDDQDLTITPGVKYVHWNHAVNAPVGQGNLCGVGASSGAYNPVTNPTGTNGFCPNAAGSNYQESFITRKVLPFAEVNYKITPSWSTYFEYAQGIYVPDIGAFEENPPTAPGKFPAPETTTNYQFGTVYYADQFTFDADVYYIPISNNYTTVTNTTTCPDTCFENTGKAVYKGLEGEGTYAFDNMFGFDVHGLSVFMNGALMYSKSNGYWVQSAPEWTAAAGIIYQTQHWKFGLIDKHVGRQFSDNKDLKQYEIPVYSQLNLTAGYSYGNAEFDIQVDNLLDSRKVTEITENGYVGTPSWQNSVDQYFFQGPRMVMGTIKWHM